jgi:hypothetical protein
MDRRSATLASAAQRQSRNAGFTPKPSFALAVSLPLCG